MIQFSPSEIEIYYRTRVPRLVKSGKSWRAKCPIHDGDGLNLAINRETGAWHCFSQCGRGGDPIDFEKALTGTRFPEARREVYGIVGRNPWTDAPMKPRYSERDIMRGELLVIGLYWHLLRAIEAVTAELWGPQHEKAAAALPTLTRWRERVASWHDLRLNGHPRNPRAFWETYMTLRGQHEALELLPQLSPALVGDCIAEANEAYELLARAIGGQAQEAAA